MNYKGSDTFPTKLGAFLSIGLSILVLIDLAVKTLDMVKMNDPSIVSYERPLYTHELDELGTLQSAEYDFNAGVSIEVNFMPYEIPESVGKFVSW